MSSVSFRPYCGADRGACGLMDADTSGVALNWIMITPGAQGSGVGSAMMSRVIKLARAAGHPLIRIAASHRSAAFFARFGAEKVRRTEDGWGPDMHRVDMELRLPGGQ